MASRGARKAGTHRMDGAIAALTPLGFSKKLIHNTIRELIMVYGDNDAGWYFVEENYYMLAIDKIIEDQEGKKEEDDKKNEEGCDGSILLDDTPTFTGEKNAFPNKNSARVFKVIDTVKSSVKASCNATVSCSDIVALASRDGVVQLGGPTWTVALGRRDATTASQSTANSDLPGPSSSLSTLISMFAAKGLNACDMTALSGAHTIGQAQCQFFRSRIYNDNNINPGFAALHQANCPQTSGGDGNLAPLDLKSPNKFGSEYYQNLIGSHELFHSDQELFNNGTQDALVRQYSNNRALFFRHFATAMVKMGAVTPLTS